MVKFLDTLKDILSACIWQGIAGIAQILAAIFSIITIVQARKMYQQADLARKESVAPDWIIDNITHGRFTEKQLLESEFTEVSIDFRNVGFGPALYVKASFTGNNKTDIEVKVTPHIYNKGSKRFYNIGDVARAIMKIDPHDIPFCGDIVLEYKSRLGYIHHDKSNISVTFENNLLKVSPGIHDAIPGC